MHIATNSGKIEISLEVKTAEIAKKFSKILNFKYCYLVESFSKVMIILNKVQVNEINKTGLILPLKK